MRRGRTAEHGPPDLEILARGEMAVERRALDRRPDAPQDLDAVLAERPAEHVDRAFLLAQESEDQAQRRGLARAVGAEEAVDRPGRDFEIDLVENGVG